MKSRLLLLSLAVLLVPAALAENSPLSLSTAERARQFEQNLPLLQALVEGSLRLADTADPLQRAQDCEILAEKVASALGPALENSDRARIEELSAHLQAVLSQGLAANLRAARKQVPAGSTPAREMQALVLRLEQALLPLEQRLEKDKPLEDQPLRQTLRLLREARSEIRQASSMAGEEIP